MSEPATVETPTPNPIVADLVRDANARRGGAAPRGRGRPPTRDPAMSKEAIRSRARRAAAKTAAPGQTVDKKASAPQTEPPPPTEPPAPEPEPEQPGERFTPADMRRELGPTPTAAADPDQAERAKRNVAMMIRAAGWIAAAVFKRDFMKVPETDANDTAELIIDAWPELAVLDADGKKFFAVIAVGTLAFERYQLYQASEPRLPAGGPVAVVDAPPEGTPAAAAPGLHHPVVTL